MIFQQGNVPCCSARAKSQFRATNAVPVLPWPSCSPNLHPNEHLWGVTKQKIRREKFSKFSSFGSRNYFDMEQLEPQSDAKLEKIMR